LPPPPKVVLDAAARHDLAVITGSPAKLWIAALSIGYDLIFVAQHYLLYAGDDAADDAARPDTADASSGGGGGTSTSSGVKRGSGARVEPAAAAGVSPSGGFAPRAVLAFSEVGRRWVGGKKQ
jgi:hypothetical protein